MKTFNSKEEAEKWLNDHQIKAYKKNKYAYKGVYELRHGEYEAPDFSIRKMKGEDKYLIRVFVFYLPGTCNAPSDHWLTEEEAYYGRLNF